MYFPLYSFCPNILPVICCPNRNLSLLRRRKCPLASDLQSIVIPKRRSLQMSCTSFGGHWFSYNYLRVIYDVIFVHKSLFFFMFFFIFHQNFWPSSRKVFYKYLCWKGSLLVDNLTCNKFITSPDKQILSFFEKNCLS